MPSSRRIDVGGAEDLQPIALAAADDLAAEHPDQQVVWEASFYGRSTWGMCLGSSEAVAVHGRGGWNIETCEKSGIRLLSMPIARDVWLVVADRASMRPEVVTYVERTLARAPASARAAGVAPLTDAQLDRARRTYDAFVRDARAAGVMPLVG